jgi:hypothetical protein
MGNIVYYDVLAGAEESHCVKEDYTVRSKSRCAIRLRYIDLVVSVDARRRNFRNLL